MSDQCMCPIPAGELFTLAVLDREKEVECNMAAKATDGGGRSCQADILLRVQDMNDNPPHFTSSHYEVTVFDNTTVRTPIAVLYARDPDTGEFRVVQIPPILSLQTVFIPSFLWIVLFLHTV